jgi:peptide/nickel transport system ATP-binding protein
MNTESREQAVALSIRGLRVDVAESGNDIVDEITLTIRKGEVLGLVGESGSGKTTVGLAVLGHARRGVAISAGKITMKGASILDLSDRELRNVRGSLVSYVPQDPGAALNPALRIGLQVFEVLETHGYGANRAERDARVAEAFGEVKLPSDSVSVWQWRSPLDPP